MIRVFYFGCVNETGHFLWDPGPFRAPRDDAGVVPWKHEEIDGALCLADADRHEYQVEGRAALHHRGGWSALAFWDRSVDRRGGSNSVFLAEGTWTADEMLRLARERFPELIGRMRFAISVTEPA